MRYPLLNYAFSSKDLNEGIKVLRSGRLTMSKKTIDFEKYFSRKIKSNFSIMTNSGSSANLLSVATACNPARKNFLKPKDEVLIPAVCWSTSLWPLIQCGLKPIFMDVDINNFCLDEKRITKNIINKIKVILTIHILGNSSNIQEISSIAKKK